MQGGLCACGSTISEPPPAADPGLLAFLGMEDVMTRQVVTLLVALASPLPANHLRNVTIPRSN